jgi:hypothetical protein
MKRISAISYTTFRFKSKRKELVVDYIIDNLPRWEDFDLEVSNAPQHEFQEFLLC